MAAFDAALGRSENTPLILEKKFRMRSQSYWQEK